MISASIIAAARFETQIMQYDDWSWYTTNSSSHWCFGILCAELGLSSENIYF
jgi:hypothetical protein